MLLYTYLGNDSLHIKSRQFKTNDEHVKGKIQKYPV